MENPPPKDPIQKSLDMIEKLGTMGSSNIAHTNELIFHFSVLLSKIAEQQAEAARKMERYTRWLIGLTIVLAVVAFFDFIKILRDFCH